MGVSPPGPVPCDALNHLRSPVHLLYCHSQQLWQEGGGRGRPRRHCNFFHWIARIVLRADVAPDTSDNLRPFWGGSAPNRLGWGDEAARLFDNYIGKIVLRFTEILAPRRLETLVVRLRPETNVIKLLRVYGGCLGVMRR